MLYLRMKKESGMTLLETIVVLMLSMIVTTTAVQLLMYATRNSSAIYTHHELLENARIAMDSLATHILSGEKIELITDSDHTLRKLTVFISSHPYEFTYNANTTTRLHRLDFGDNELASYITNLTMVMEDGYLEIYIKTDSNIENGVPVKPIELRRILDLRFVGGE